MLWRVGYREEKEKEMPNGWLVLLHMLGIEDKIMI